jgi:8-oxo-dGTP pyrophosphatase MutT (NUDIX family)
MHAYEIRSGHRVGVFILVRKNGKILLLKRKNTGYRDGWYTMPSGHLEKEESISTAAIREAEEEVGIRISRRDLETIHVSHKYEYGEGALMVVAVARRWSGTPANKEPEKCSGIGWFSPDKLPRNTIPYVRNAIRMIQGKVFYSEFGWR